MSLGLGGQRESWRTFDWKTLKVEECILVMRIGSITEYFGHNSTAQTVHNFLVKLEYITRKLLDLLSATVCVHLN
jgi:hypothetical protein